MCSRYIKRYRSFARFSSTGSTHAMYPEDSVREFPQSGRSSRDASHENRISRKVLRERPHYLFRVFNRGNCRYPTAVFSPVDAGEGPAPGFAPVCHGCRGSIFKFRVKPSRARARVRPVSVITANLVSNIKRRRDVRGAGAHPRRLAYFDV